MPWKPTVEGEVPTLGYYVLDWIAENLAAPAVAEYEPFAPYQEQEDFILRWYELDPKTCRFRYDRGLLGRPRGWGKSPLLAALAIVEALADVVPAGWDSAGQPIGEPWSRFKTPLVHIAAVSEAQVRNTWQPLQEMLEGPVVDNYPGLEPMDTMVNLPRGQILKITSSARTVKGAPTIFAILDQTEEWVPSNGGPSLAQTIRTNTSKNGGRTVESPNAYIPGENSVAEASAQFAASIKEGRALTKGMLWDHREAPADTDMWDRDSLIAGLRHAYGDSSGHEGGCVIHAPACPPGHVDLDALVNRIYDPATDPQVARSDFLNQITHASDSWVSQPEWASCMDLDRVISPDEPIVLGFDGSKGRAKGKADATALVGCRVLDGHLFELRVWEQPAGAAGREWTPPALEVDAEVRGCFSRFNVVGFYGDPTGWESYFAKWEAEFGRRLKVKATQNAPMSAWPRGKHTNAVEAVEKLRTAILQGELTHDGSASLTRHVLNARMRASRTGYLLYKAYPDSPEKIDAAYAATMAWKARLDALAAGIGKRSRSKGKVVVL